MKPNATGRPNSFSSFDIGVLRYTAAGTPETFELAGELGANVLTHLLGQRLDQLEANITRYRDAWRAHGHTGTGHVALMARR